MFSNSITVKLMLNIISFRYSNNLYTRLHIHTRCLVFSRYIQLRNRNKLMIFIINFKHWMFHVKFRNSLQSVQNI
jgi:hypothetical protein